jgi:hypothetical protein
MHPELPAGPAHELYQVAVLPDAAFSTEAYSSSVKGNVSGASILMGDKRGIRSNQPAL